MCQHGRTLSTTIDQLCMCRHTYVGCSTNVCLSMIIRPSSSAAYTYPISNSHSNLVAMWHVLAGETQLLRMVFTNLLEVMALSLPYQEKAKGQGRVTRMETTVPKAVSVTMYVCVCNYSLCYAACTNIMCIWLAFLSIVNSMLSDKKIITVYIL